MYKVAAAKAVYREFDREKYTETQCLLMFKVSVDNLNFKGGFRVREVYNLDSGAKFWISGRNPGFYFPPKNDIPKIYTWWVNQIRSNCKTGFQKMNLWWSPRIHPLLSKGY